MPILSSVGSGGKNSSGDVLFVQLLLNDWRSRSKIAPIAVDGIVGPETIGALQAFQKRFTHIVDGRADPDGPTIKKLEELYLQGILSGKWNPACLKYLRPTGPQDPTVQRAYREYLKVLRHKLG